MVSRLAFHVSGGRGVSSGTPCSRVANKRRFSARGVRYAGNVAEACGGGLPPPSAIVPWSGVCGGVWLGWRVPGWDGGCMVGMEHIVCRPHWSAHCLSSPFISEFRRVHALGGAPR
eukprot:353210-Chlamydomonas_euryale.AAC.4